MDRPEPRRLVGWRVVAMVASVLSAVCLIVSIRLDLMAPPADEIGSATFGGAIPGLALTIPGALLLWRLGPHPMALVLTGFGVMSSVDGPAAGVVNVALAGVPSGVDPALASWGFWYYARFGALLPLAVLLILLLFPDGRLARGAWRWVSIASLALTAITPVAFLLAPASALAADEPSRQAMLDRFDPALPTLPLPDPVWQVLLAVAFPALVLATLLAVAVTIGRRRGASEELRAQLRWLIWAGIVFLVLVALVGVLPAPVVDVLFPLGVASVSTAILIAVTRHGLYAIDRLLSWTIVYVALVAGVVLLDLTIYLTLGSLIDDRVTLVVAVVVVVVVYTPLRDRIHGWVSRWINGTRADPYEVISELSDRLDRVEGVQERLAELADAVARAFASPAVRVELYRPDGIVLSAQTAPTGPEATVLPIGYGGTEIGRILMRPGRRPAISRRDRRLLGDIVRLSAAALRGAELSRELQLIRQDLVATREEERARLRRELHDGLGPLLGGIRLRLETARNLVDRDPATSARALDDALDESREVLDEIRRLVHDLRPPALDDLGLVRAIAQQGDRLSGATFRVSIDAAPLPALGAALEVAAYRIAAESLTNAFKHAGAAHAAVRLRSDGAAVVVEVEDDGVGIPADRTAGVGLASMRERAAELGGAVEFLDAGPGTLVRATLPLRTPHPARVP